MFDSKMSATLEKKKLSACFKVNLEIFNERKREKSNTQDTNTVAALRRPQINRLAESTVIA